jgi:hypothetical protein
MSDGNGNSNGNQGQGGGGGRRRRRGKPQNQNQNQNQQRRPQQAVDRAQDMWRPVPRPPEPTPIVPSNDPTAVIRSLGHPPLPGQGTSAELYIATVVERASGLATALAASAGLLDTPDTE